MKLPAFLAGLFGRSTATRSRPRRALGPGHQGARGDRLLSDVPKFPTPVDIIVENDLSGLRARSRWLAENDPSMSRFLGLLETEVVGDGVTPVVRVEDQDGQPDVALNEAVLEAWKRWSEDRKRCDMAARHSIPEMEALYVRTVAEDGEFLAQKVVGRGGLGLHLLDAELLDNSYKDELPNDAYVRNGVECNRWNKPVAYHIKKLSGSSAILFGYIADDLERYPAAAILHGFLARRIGQKRGLPWAAPAIFPMRQLVGLTEAALTSARAGANQMGVLEKELGETDPGHSEETPGGSRVIETEPAILFELNPGEKLAEFKPNQPDAQLDPFARLCLRSISAGLNVSYPSLSNDLENMSYSSIRSGKTSENSVFRKLQGWAIRTFNKPVFRAWLESELSSRGIATIDGRAVRMRDVDRILESTLWIPRGWDWVDPQREVAARVEEVRAGLRSRSEIIRARGGDPMTVYRELAEEKKTFEELGISDEATGAVPVVADKEDDEE